MGVSEAVLGKWSIYQSQHGPFHYGHTCHTFKAAVDACQHASNLPLPPSLARSLSLSLSRSWYREVQADDGGYPSKLTAMSGYGTGPPCFSPSFVSNWIEQPQEGEKWLGTWNLM